MPFQLIWMEEVRKDLKSLEKTVAERIYKKIVWANENNSLFLEKVEGTDYLKYRVGSYRTFFEKGPENALFALTVKHRSVAYKRIKK